MSHFTTAEIEYVKSQRLGRLATVNQAGEPHVVPVAFRYNAEMDTIDISGRSIGSSKKFRDIAQNANVAFVVDKESCESKAGAEKLVRERRKSVPIRNRLHNLFIVVNQGEGLDKRKKSKEKDRTSFRYFALDDSFASFTPTRHGQATMVVTKGEGHWLIVAGQNVDSTATYRQADREGVVHRLA